ncbi:hypothetical protein SKAU_G00083050 [Synaphobranchus kaupii]|uniref:Uncharacterized protein n=1 Tax=Synaphobranchus kaupii TaxID=118154 RepID=A0A9Q1FVA5_SYNKA|nr:hypothetical protein SKAU_G00083050 [Synaphobranchus kaupii]
MKPEHRNVYGAERSPPGARCRTGSRSAVGRRRQPSCRCYGSPSFRSFRPPSPPPLPDSDTRGSVGETAKASAWARVERGPAVSTRAGCLPLGRQMVRNSASSLHHSLRSLLGRPTESPTPPYTHPPPLLHAAATASVDGPVSGGTTCRVSTGTDPCCTPGLHRKSITPELSSDMSKVHFIDRGARAV